MGISKYLMVLCTIGLSGVFALSCDGAVDKPAPDSGAGGVDSTSSGGRIAGQGGGMTTSTGGVGKGGSDGGASPNLGGRASGGNASLGGRSLGGSDGSARGGGGSAGAVAGAAGMGSSACVTAADCRLFDDYCTGCDCRALGKSDPDPSCSGPGVRCLVAPCRDLEPVCTGGRCLPSGP